LELFDDDRFYRFKAWVKIIAEKNGYADFLTNSYSMGKRKSPNRRIKLFCLLGIVMQIPDVFPPRVERALRSNKSAYERLYSVVGVHYMATEKQSVDTIETLRRFWT